MQSVERVGWEKSSLGGRGGKAKEEIVNKEGRERVEKDWRNRGGGRVERDRGEKRERGKRREREKT